MWPSLRAVVADMEAQGVAVHLSPVNVLDLNDCNSAACADRQPGFIDWTRLQTAEWNSFHATGPQKYRYLSAAAISDPQVEPVFASFDSVTIQLSPVSLITWGHGGAGHSSPGMTIAQNAGIHAALRLNANWEIRPQGP
jgi:hypothetical protein